MPTERKITLPDDLADPRVRALQADAFEHLLATGKAMPVDEQDLATVADLLNRGRLTVEAGAIDGVLGLTIRATRHRLQLPEGVRYTWCALDAVAIMAVLGRSGTVTTRAAPDDEVLRVVFASGEVVSAPPGAVLLVPGEPTGPVVETWCPMANLFPGPDHAHAFARHHALTGYTVLELAEAIAEGAPLWAAALNRQR
ncbi:organomercurial lyase [Nonomuraea endophytica]|uniref:organomercurial lyase n=1 Tax=Nonomuraea endophytica TaxID=714136 RepID=UPI0037C82197